jgi:hypothetical protein
LAAWADLLGDLSPIGFEPDHSNVTDVERHLQSPLFMTVPDTRWRGNKAVLHAVTNGAPPPRRGGGPAHSWERNQSLHAYYEGLRDGWSPILKSTK